MIKAKKQPVNDCVLVFGGNPNANIYPQKPGGEGRTV